MYRDEANREKIKRYSSSIDHMILFCKFGMNSCNLDQDFDHVFNYYYGNCFRFNWNREKIKKNFRPSLFYGLDLTLYLGVPDKVKERIYPMDKEINVYVGSIQDNPFDALPYNFKVIILDFFLF